MPIQAYESGEYLSKNPTWDIEDSAWKANEVFNILKKKSLVEMGCGAGGILASLQDARPDIEYKDYEIASSTETFWEAYKSRNIAFKVEDFLHAKPPHFDTLLLLDVIEHLPNLFDFMNALRGRSDNYILHIPLDLSAVRVIRETPLMKVRSKVGHIHYFTKGLSLSLLHECGYEIVDWHYKGSSFHVPKTSWKTRLARLPRRLVYAINRDMGVRLLGGDTLMVLARS